MQLPGVSFLVILNLAVADYSPATVDRLPQTMARSVDARSEAIITLVSICCRRVLCRVWVRGWCFGAGRELGLRLGSWLHFRASRTQHSTVVRLAGSLSQAIIDFVYQMIVSAAGFMCVKVLEPV